MLSRISIEPIGNLLILIIYLLCITTIKTVFDTLCNYRITPLICYFLLLLYVLYIFIVY